MNAFLLLNFMYEIGKVWLSKLYLCIEDNIGSVLITAFVFILLPFVYCFKDFTVVLFHVFLRISEMALGAFGNIQL